MSLAKTSGQLLIDVDGVDLTANDIDILKHPRVSGVVLFKKNFINSPQLKNLCKKIHSIRDDLIVSVDHEGGRIQRFKDEFTDLPPINNLSEIANTNIDLAISVAKRQGSIMAKDLLEHGIDVSLGPVLDCCFPNTNNDFYKRCFSHDPKILIKLASSYISGMSGYNIFAIGKHFPGHGYVQEDTHVAKAIDNRSVEDLIDHDILPYIALQSSLQGIMLSHVVFPAVDDVPCSISNAWVKFMRKDLKLSQIILTDCLSMSAIANFVNDPVERVYRAFSAGVDIVIFCNDRPAVEKVLSELPAIACSKIKKVIQNWKVVI